MPVTHVRGDATKAPADVGPQVTTILGRLVQHEKLVSRVVGHKLHPEVAGLVLITLASEVLHLQT